MYIVPANQALVEQDSAVDHQSSLIITPWKRWKSRWWFNKRTVVSEHIEQRVEYDRQMVMCRGPVSVDIEPMLFERIAYVHGELQLEEMKQDFDANCSPYDTMTVVALEDDSWKIQYSEPQSNEESKVAKYVMQIRDGHFESFLTRVLILVREKFHFELTKRNVANVACINIYVTEILVEFGLNVVDRSSIPSRIITRYFVPTHLDEEAHFYRNSSRYEDAMYRYNNTRVVDANYQRYFGFGMRSMVGPPTSDL